MQQTTRFTSIMMMLGSVLLLARCAGASPEAKQAEADGAYAAGILACVDDAGTLAESHACRARVDLVWGVKRPVTVPPHMLIQPPELLDGGPRDGGAQ